jgi:hypothetical protein
MVPKDKEFYYFPKKKIQKLIFDGIGEEMD